MISATEALSFDPVEFVGPECRLFIDTNVFMDTDVRRNGGLKRLFERIAPTIQQGGSPVIVPTKVIDELNKQSRLDPSELNRDRAEAVGKAANSLVFLNEAEGAGLVRNDLGHDTNPYADDLFVNLFKAYSEKYAMLLLTNDITLLIRINVLGVKLGHWVAAGRLSRDGLIECDAPQALYERGLGKLRALKHRTGLGEGGPKDTHEIASLESSLDEYQRAFGTVTPDEPDHRGRAERAGHHSRPAKLALIEGAFSAMPDYKGEDHQAKVVDVPGDGDEVLVESPTGNKTLTLMDRLGVGGEGSVYSVSETHVVKIFDAEHNTRHREEKIKLLAARGFTEPGICFPQAVVKNLDGDFVGYLMPKAKGKEFSKAVFSPRRFKKEYANWTKADLVDVAISFLEKVAYLHSLNIILGDINPKNLLVDATKEVWVIDADSWQLEGYPCPVGTEMFSAPEVIGKRYPEFLRTIENEQFAVATMLFMTLITGQFPYARSGSDGDIVRLIKEGNFAFQYKGNSNGDQPSGNWKYMWSHLQVGLKGLFWNTFHREGDRYDNRPSDEEWLRAFREYRRHLGSEENFDPMSNDVYPTRFKAMSVDTPIYQCAECQTSMVGIWSDKTKAFATPKVCMECKSNQPKCSDCSRHKASLRDGRCWDCNRKRNMFTCTVCGKEKPNRALRGSASVGNSTPTSTRRATASTAKNVATNGLSSAEDFLAAVERTLRFFTNGDLVDGTVVKVGDDEVLLDVGYRTEGVVPARELLINRDGDPLAVSVGDKVEALVLQKEDREGRLILSLSRAHEARGGGAAGICRDCDRKMNSSACVICGAEKPTKSLIEGRCYGCNQGNCSSCMRSIPKHYLANGLCDHCQPVACTNCGIQVKKSEASYGRCPSCQEKDVERRALEQAERQKQQAERQKQLVAQAAHNNTMDPLRPCARCGKPFITHGNVAWHQRKGKSVPTTHKRGYGSTYPAECVPLPPTAAQGTSVRKASNGCFVATAVYGSYDCPQVWVLRRWRDSSLLTTRRGRVFVRIYYATSPRLVVLLGRTGWFTLPARNLLDAWVKVLMRSGHSDRPYSDREPNEIDVHFRNTMNGAN